MAGASRITFVIDHKTDDELTALAHELGQHKTSLAREALIEWLDPQIDIRDAKAIIAQNKPTIPLEEVKRLLGLDEDVPPRQP